MQEKIEIKFSDPRAAKHLEKLASRFQGISAIAFIEFVKRFGIEPWIRQQRKCPNCQSNKWKQLGIIPAEEIMAGANLIALAGFDVYPALVKYQCQKCEHTFSFWQTCDIFESPLRGECPQCGSKKKENRWEKLSEDEVFETYRYKQCHGSVFVDKSLKETQQQV